MSSAVGGLIERYTELTPASEILIYQYGYYGLLTGDSYLVGAEGRAKAGLLHRYGGSPIGNSRVKLTNAADLVRRGLVGKGEDPLAAAARRLREDRVDVLHTIGGDDTNTTAADLAAYLREHGYGLTVVGLPKTIDNDVVPIKQSLGAWTAAEQASIFAQNIIGEHRSNPRMLIVHEVMGRNCGWLTAAAATDYRRWLGEQEWNPAVGLTKERWDIHGVYIPELELDLAAESERLKAIMDRIGNVNIFLSEGAGIETIVHEMEVSGQEVVRDPFGHVKLDTINPGSWYAREFAERMGALKTMVQKSGYFSRSARAGERDLLLIRSMVDLAVDCALAGQGGVIGHDEDNGDVLGPIAFDRVRGGKAFDVAKPWFRDLLDGIGQPH
ncbi:MAG: pyrophosphate--fructose-6-phosphate 1-phosphotransferase [Bifidobacteriaceae bacterium]|nr:pyrophosphate--fructose-6-phosphate 1-phosphotransferase [Bifidobacteriaceae bacterium]